MSILGMSRWFFSFIGVFVFSGSCRGDELVDPKTRIDAMVIMEGGRFHLGSFKQFDVVLRIETNSFVKSDIVPHAVEYWRVRVDESQQCFAFFRAEERMDFNDAIRGDLSNWRLRERGLVLRNGQSFALEIGGAVSLSKFRDPEEALAEMRFPRLASLGLGKFEDSVFNDIACFNAASSILGSATSIVVDSDDTPEIVARLSDDRRWEDHRWKYSRNQLHPSGYRIVQGIFGKGEARPIYQQTISWEDHPTYGHVPSKIEFEEKLRFFIGNGEDRRAVKGFRGVDVTIKWLPFEDHDDKSDIFCSDPLTAKLINSVLTEARKSFDVESNLPSDE